MSVRLSVLGNVHMRGTNPAIRELTRLEIAARRAGSGTAAGLFAASAAMQKSGAKMAAAGAMLQRRVTVPVLALAAAGVYAYAKFEGAMTKSTAIMGDVTDKTRKKMEDAARAVATTLPVSHAEAAESYYFLASAGMNAKQSIAALPQVAKFATAGAFDMATATDLATDAQSALGLTSKNAQKNLEGMTRVTDVLTKANTLANATIEQFSSSLTRKSGTAMKKYRLEMESGVSALAVFADKGVKGELAGTMLSNTIEGLARNAIKNSEAFKDLGVQVFDSNGRMRDLGSITKNLEGAMEGMSDKERTAALMKMGFNKQALDGIGLLMGSSEQMKTYEKELRNAGGTTDEVANKQMKSFVEQLRLLKDKLIDAGITIGEIVVPELMNLYGYVERGIAWFRDLDKGTQRNIVKWGLLAAAAGPVLKVLGRFVMLGGKVVGVAGKIVLGFSKGIAKAPRYARAIAGATRGLGHLAKAIASGVTSLARQAAKFVVAAGKCVLHTAALVAHRTWTLLVSGATKGWAAAQWLMNAAMSANPIGLVIAAVAGLALGLVIAYKKSETFRKIVNAAWGAVKKAAVAVFDFLADFFKKWVGRVRAGLAGIGKVASWVVERFTSLRDGAVKAFTRVIDFARSLPGRIKSAVGNLGTLLYNAGGDILRGVWNGMQSIAGWLKDKITSFFKNLLPGWAKKALGIGSPSKVFADIGRWSGLGLASGLDASRAMVAAAAGRMVGAAAMSIGGPRIAGPSFAGGGRLGGGGGRIVTIAVDFDVNIDGSGLGQDQLTTAVRSGVEPALEKLAREIRSL